jgi:hypothetical protein
MKLVLGNPNVLGRIQLSVCEKFALPIRFGRAAAR